MISAAFGFLIFIGFVSTPSAFAKDDSAYFKDTYQESRQVFLKNAGTLKHTFPQLELRTYELPTASGEKLTTETLYLPPESGQKDRLLILISGLHGIEGYVGSALQNKFIEENFWQLRDKNLGLLIIHAVNPYGFQFSRRVTEQNIDLNRNFVLSPEVFQSRNGGYEKVAGLLNPKTPATSGFWSRCRFYLEAGWVIFQHSMDSLRRAVLKGQYQFPKGIYYGGQAFEPQKNLLEQELLSRGESYQQVLLIDLHTGYGKRGQLHLFADRSPLMDENYVNKIFAGQTLDYAQKKDFYEVSGGLVIFAAQLFQGKTQYAGMVFEFGTLDSQKTAGSMDSIYRMIRENQLAHYGSDTEKSRAEIQKLFREMFYPSSAEWRKSVAKQFREALSQALQNQSQ